MSDQIDVNQLADTLNNKMDLDMSNIPSNVDYVVESKYPTSSDPTWYRVYKSGWVEQGGYVYAGTSQANVNHTITLNKQMANTYYTVIFGELHSTEGAGVWGSENYTSRTTTTISLHSGSAGFYGYFWEVKGMGA